MIVSAPASSANLGPGFDCLGLGVELPFRLHVGGDVPEDLIAVEPTHPAAEAFAAAGGRPSAQLSWRSPIPPGRGLGFSGAARVAGAYLAARQNGSDPESARDQAFRIASRLEGHPDNAAASAYGGFVVAVEDRVQRLAVPPGVQLVIWWPPGTTSTDRSRAELATDVAMADASFNIARTALWVAAISRGDLGALRVVCEDRLHQDVRLAGQPESALALERALAEPVVLAAWLSGSGPAVAAMVGVAHAESVARLLTGDTGRVRVVDIAGQGVAELPMP